IRVKLFGLDRNASPPQLRSASVSPSTTYLQLWFGRSNLPFSHHFLDCKSFETMSHLGEGKDE
ncbi:unnamed protein product, partial [Brassica napus]